MIQDVSLRKEASSRVANRPPPTSPELEELRAKEKAIKRTLRRHRGTFNSLEGYLSQHLAKVSPDILLFSVDRYSEAAQKYDELIAGLEQELDQVDEEIVALSERLIAEMEEEAPKSPLAWRCTTTVTVNVTARSEGTVEFTLVYGTHIVFPMCIGNADTSEAVPSASWAAAYDIRVTTESKGSPVEITYKAKIRQDTGEVRTLQPVASNLLSVKHASGLE